MFLAFFDVRDKWLYFLLPLAVLPDIISLFALGRVSHSIILASIIFAVIFLIVWRTKNSMKIATFSGVYLFSHLILDFGSWMPLLWPLDPNFYRVGIELIIKNSIPLFNIIFETASSLPAVAEYVPTPITAGGFALLIVLLIAFLINLFDLDKN